MILHGLFGSGRNWFSIAKKLAGARQLILVDLRNHGQSAHTADMSFQHMADDIKALVDTLDLQKVDVIGHSMGGKVAMMFALNYPDNLKRLLIMDVAPKTYHTDFAELIEHMDSLPLTAIRSRKEADTHLARAIPQEGLRSFLLHNLAREAGRFIWRINLAAIRNNLATLCAFPNSFKHTHSLAPALFLAGATSNYLAEEDHEYIKALFPNATFINIEHAGHWLHADQPEAVLAEINRFLI